MSDRPVRIATLGAAFSANKGAASMLEAVIETAPQYVGDCSFDVLTTYPRQDSECSSHTSVRVLSASPMELAVVLWPLALLSAIASRVGLGRSPFLRTEAIRAIAEADVVVDLAGISFADGRGMATLAYNALMTSLPLLLGRPTIKMSQAIGPIRARGNRVLAASILSRVRTICARGIETEGHLMDAGLSNVVVAADLAFSLPSDEDSDEWAAARTDGYSEMIAVIPSMVVDRYCAAIQVDYRTEVVALINTVISNTGSDVILFAHASRPGEPAGKMNDLPLCREINERVSDPSRCHLIDDDLSPSQLRSLVARCSVAVTSRFHAMISALATATPVVVAGWSHKYREVLAEFDLEDLALSYSELDADALMELVSHVMDARAAISASISSHLPEVLASSARNFEVLRSVLGDQS